MYAERSQLDEVNVLASAMEWAWPEAVRSLFKPRGVNLLVAREPREFVQVITNRRIHTTIVDVDTDRSAGMATIRIIRMENPLVPCILLTSRTDPDVLEKALQLDVFGVIGKPVNMNLLQQVLNRLFIKKYNSDLFAL